MRCLARSPPTSSWPAFPLDSQLHLAYLTDRPGAPPHLAGCTAASIRDQLDAQAALLKEDFVPPHMVDAADNHQQQHMEAPVDREWMMPAAVRRCQQPAWCHGAMMRCCSKHRFCQSQRFRAPRPCASADLAQQVATAGQQVATVAQQLAKVAQSQDEMKLDMRNLAAKLDAFMAWYAGENSGAPLVNLPRWRLVG